MTDSGEPADGQRRLLLQITTQFPNSIETLSSKIPEYSYTCGMHAFEFESDDRYRQIASCYLPPPYAGKEFINWLIQSGSLIEIEKPDAKLGDLIIYFFNDEFAHIGRLAKADRIISKWGTGLLCNHALLEVPSSYGEIVRYFQSISTNDAIVSFQNYAEATTIDV
jgi:hypothetical protein